MVAHAVFSVSWLGWVLADKVADTGEHDLDQPPCVIAIVTVCCFVTKVQPSCYVLLLQKLIHRRLAKVSVHCLCLLGLPVTLIRRDSVLSTEISKMHLQNGSDDDCCRILVTALQQVVRHG